MSTNPVSEKDQLPQFPMEKTDDCPVCGEKFCRFEFTKKAEVKSPTVPFCIKSSEDKLIQVYYHE